jgi:hypothetical protein
VPAIVARPAQVWSSSQSCADAADGASYQRVTEEGPICDAGHIAKPATAVFGVKGCVEVEGECRCVR